MSLLRSFSFGIEHGRNEIPAEILAIFSGLTEKELTDLTYSSEIVEAGMKGKLDLTRRFNMYAYTAGIVRKKKLKQSQSRDVYMVDAIDTEEFAGISISQKTVTQEYATNHVADYMIDAYDELVDKEALEAAVSALKEANIRIASTKGVNLIAAMRSYIVDKIEESAAFIKEVCASDAELADHIYTILDCKESFADLFGDCC